MEKPVQVQRPGSHCARCRPSRKKKCDISTLLALRHLNLALTPRASAIASSLKTGMVHINNQTVKVEFQVPFGSMGASSSGSRLGGPANIDAFTTTQWVSSTARPITYPF